MPNERGREVTDPEVARLAGRVDGHDQQFNAVQRDLRNLYDKVGEVSAAADHAQRAAVGAGAAAKSAQQYAAEAAATSGEAKIAAVEAKVVSAEAKVAALDAATKAAEAAATSIETGGKVDTLKDLLLNRREVGAVGAMSGTAATAIGTVVAAVIAGLAAMMGYVPPSLTQQQAPTANHAPAAPAPAPHPAPQAPVGP